MASKMIGGQVGNPDACDEGQLYIIFMGCIGQSTEPKGSLGLACGVELMLRVILVA